MRTPLYENHVRLGAKMVDFAGWDMPVQFSTIIAEHNAVRTAGGLVDVSHMGRLRFEGPGAAEFLYSTITLRVCDMSLGKVRYSLVTNEQGFVLDDVLLGYYLNDFGQPYYMLVVNAGNHDKIVKWIKAHLTEEIATAPGKEVIFNDMSSVWAMIAVQGPNSLELLQPLVDVDLKSMRYYRGSQCRFLHPCAQRQGGIVSRTGYTGEDGFEITLGAGIASDFWDVLVEMGKPLGVIPTGLGCRDTLRLEAGMPLYGHELSESINPIEAGLGSACYLDGYDFPGRDALKKIAQEPLTRTRVGLEILGKRPAREGCKLFVNDEEVGYVTSGSPSPTLGKNIAMGYVKTEFAEPDTMLTVDIRGNKAEAKVVPLPFYKRAKK